MSSAKIGHSFADITHEVAYIDSFTTSLAGSETSSSISNGSSPSKKSSTSSIIESNSAKISADKVVKSSHKNQSAMMTPKKPTGSRVFSPMQTSTPRRRAVQTRPGPKLPTPGQIAISGAENAAEMDGESGVNPLNEGEIGEEDNGEEDNGEEDGEEEDGEEDGEEDDEDPSVPNAMNNVREKHKTKRGLPFDPNGRFHGRQLVMWHRPRMIEKLILHVQYECHRRGIIVPWDHIVHRLSPGSSGPSALQHLNKMRDVLVSEGHMVPPLLGKVTVKQDPQIRGFIRDMDAELPTTTRIVRWDEKIVDLKESLVVPGVVRGSGNYRRGAPQAIAKTTQNPDGTRRNRLPAPLQEEMAERTAKRNRKPKADSAGTYTGTPSRASMTEVDPNDLDSEEEYNPSAKKRRSSRRKSSIKRKSYVDDDETDFEGSDTFTTPTKVPHNTPGSSSFMTPVKVPRMSMMTPPKSSLPIKFSLPSDKLAKFPIGEHGISAYKPIKDHAQSSSDTCYFKKEVNANENPFYQSSTAPQLSISGFSNNLKQFSYKGVEMHGTLPQYHMAVANGTDPLLNGTKYLREQRLARQSHLEGEIEERAAAISSLRAQVHGRSTATAPANEPGEGISFGESAYGNARSGDAGSVDAPRNNDLHVRRTHIPAPRFMDGSMTPPHAASPLDFSDGMFRTDTPPMHLEYGGTVQGYRSENGAFHSPLLVDGNSIDENHKIMEQSHGSYLLSQQAFMTGVDCGHFPNAPGHIWQDHPLQVALAQEISQNNTNQPSFATNSYSHHLDNDENEPPYGGRIITQYTAFPDDYSAGDDNERDNDWIPY